MFYINFFYITNKNIDSTVAKADLKCLLRTKSKSIGYHRRRPIILKRDDNGLKLFTTCLCL